MNRNLAHRWVSFDETQFTLGNERDVGGTRSGTYTNESLNRGGARSTRSSQHVTGGLGVTAAGEFLPPLVIFSTSAENKENYAVNDQWIAGMGITKGKYGHKSFIERRPYIAVRKVGSMDIELFMEYIENVTFDLYPENTVSLEIKLDEHGRLVSGPVMWNMDTGPGRLCSVDGDLGELWDEWAESMMQRGVILCGLLPNSTSVSAIMDKLFRAFKIASRKATQKVFAKKIKANAKAVAKLKAEMARKLANNEEVSEAEKAKVNVVANLSPADLGEILWGVLDENGYAAPNSPMATSFTKAKIEEAQAKVCFAFVHHRISSHQQSIDLTSTFVCIFFYNISARILAIHKEAA